MTYLYYQTAAVFLLLMLLIGYFIYDSYRYKQILQKIPLRIHVNGTRGKSSVTRLIAGGLRAHGLKVCAKTTGSAAKFIDPSGRESFIRRRAPANIKEITGFVRRAVRDYHAEAIVVECMAVTPSYQQTLEHKFLQADILALTNIRQDHEDIMGHGLLNIAKALANSLPLRGMLVTNAASCKLLQAIGSLPSNTISCEHVQVSEQELAYFPYEVIKENVQLAMAVCIQAGVPRKLALQGMCSSLPDVGNLSISYWQLDDRHLQLINALAANDPESSLLLWHKYIQPEERVLLLVHCRADRKERTKQILESFAPVHSGAFLLSGDTGFAMNTLRRLEIVSTRILTMSSPNRAALLNLDIVKSGEITCIFAVGNLKGCAIFEAEVS